MIFHEKIIFNHSVWFGVQAIATSKFSNSWISNHLCLIYFSVTVENGWHYYNYGSTEADFEVPDADMFSSDEEPDSSMSFLDSLAQTKQIEKLEKEIYWHNIWTFDPEIGFNKIRWLLSVIFWSYWKTSVGRKSTDAPQTRDTYAYLKIEARFINSVQENAENGHEEWFFFVWRWKFINVR